MTVHMHAGYWDLNLHSQELLLCPRSRQMFGIEGTSPRNLSKQDWMPRIYPDDIALIEGELEAAARPNEIYAARFRVVRSDGSLFHILGVGRSVTKDAKRFVGLNFDLAATATAAELESRRPFGTMSRLVGFLTVRSRPANENETAAWRGKPALTRKAVWSRRFGKGRSQREKLLDRALATMERRNLRRSFLNPALLGEPAFDILILLYVTNASPAILSLKLLAPAVGVSESCAARWLDLLVEDGLVLTIAGDGGVHAALTDKGRVALDGYFGAIDEPC
jgi:hypothetical protein